MSDDTIRAILSGYQADTPGTKANLYRMLAQGRLGGTGRLAILPVDQGFEHGPARSFAVNPPAYDPLYHFRLALEAGCSAFAAPLGLLEAGADRYAGALPLILKVNSANALSGDLEAPTQALTAGVDDALRLGCAAIGMTIYPGSDRAYDMLEDLRELAAEARAKGIAVVVWSYPRGGGLSAAGETALDVVAYGAHMACLMGANIVKVKLPSAHMEQPEAAKAYAAAGIDTSSLAKRVAHVVQSCFNGSRIVVFSGGAAKSDLAALYDEIEAIRDGGGFGSIIGRNSFQRPWPEAVMMLTTVMDILAGRARPSPPNAAAST
ncbi:class I fructose-bisphosphate aldolase [Magnetospirillum sp. UT-4]|uniref:class I fructose-bisphosphate aldolase n=1 Tax=Magnetospirillum sp. UT-4 TaxID=2681467 RepID=UPI0013815CFF|nr:class I fructose-bisphosphate aldolase [Magnetospirillum sp. UT-4]CAA7615124.1 Fructose-bisphosphate aldolase [Magnetospirillum sp. UT-4]